MSGTKAAVKSLAPSGPQALLLAKVPSLYRVIRCNELAPPPEATKLSRLRDLLNPKIMTLIFHVVIKLQIDRSIDLSEICALS